MCSILLTNKTIDNFTDINYFLKFRGPDHTSCVTYNGITFVHNLLSISGSFTPQPFEENNIVAMHNGEIYNYGDYPSDGYSLIPSYNRWGEKFCQHLDGEFAVALVDFNQRKIIFSTDLFRTKPLWYAIQDGNFAVSTYRTPIEKLEFKQPIKVPPNTILELNLDTLEISVVDNVYKWDLVQHKPYWDDWIFAWENSIRKRTKNNRERIFIGLSSGYDSGTIACELTKQEIDFAAITVMGKEPLDILKQRQVANHFWIYPNQDIWNQAHEHIRSCVESYKYTICSSSSDYNEFWLDLHDDSGSNGLSMVCNVAKSNNCKIYLSGMGADEIFSDYGFNGNKVYPHSNFGGKFPANLNSIFPWNSFYGSSMESYLAKEEYVSGSYGLESRYPFLDKQVVQEFLWASVSLKNSEYKSALANYLRVNQYPFAANQKIGF